jgi:hypothetical protein
MKDPQAALQYAARKLTIRAGRMTVAQLFQRLQFD